MIEKMKSRKFLITLLTNIIAIATLFSNNNNYFFFANVF